MTLINWEFNQVFTLPADFVTPTATGEAKFAITDKKLYVPAITLSIQDNVKMLQQLKPCFKRIINSKKHQSKVVINIKEP